MLLSTNTVKLLLSLGTWEHPCVVSPNTVRRVWKRHQLLQEGLVQVRQPGSRSGISSTSESSWAHTHSLALCWTKQLHNTHERTGRSTITVLFTDMSPVHIEHTWQNVKVTALKCSRTRYFRCSVMFHLCPMAYNCGTFLRLVAFAGLIFLSVCFLLCSGLSGHRRKQTVTNLTDTESMSVPTGWVNKTIWLSYGTHGSIQGLGQHKSAREEMGAVYKMNTSTLVFCNS